MRTLETKTVADLVTENNKTAHIFKRYGIDFCCGGGVSVKKAAEKAKISYVSLEKDLKQVESNYSGEKNYKTWELDFLADHIVNVHHSYIRENIPLIAQYGSRVVRTHAKDYPELIQIQRLFAEVAIKLSRHLRKEEQVIFPFIKDMVKAKKEEKVLSKSEYDSIENTIQIMRAEHVEAGAVFKRIGRLCNDYTPPAGACNTFRAYYAILDEFEQDLHQHVHLENNILFPKALKLEKELFDSKK